ncbi:hypothetical protein GCM10022243_09770 [Saccharothrix violaceirubra]|uniref:PLL-like beta propeller domain-containing protein n=1 Tax=Saccharothrix violaceirubra TaxID=413306 RepID=A0A7W7T451_9PSEU|nr:hypothetical protein [Saccharothrix violaceirubra]MBB4966186.1 hypothetical protein [Saccharothrix violaceirubra]
MIESRRRLLRLVLVPVVALATLIGVGMPAVAVPAAPPLPADATALSTPVIEPLGLFMASRGLDGSVLFSRGTPSTDSYTDFFSIGGQIIGDPTAVVSPEGAQVFARSTGNEAITSLVVSYSFPTAFQVIPGLRVSSEITAVRIPDRGAQPPMIRIFARGLDDGAIYTNLLIQGAPQGWVNLGGYATSEVTAAVTGPAGFTVNLRLVVRGSDNRLYSMVYNNTTGVVSSWAPIGDLVTLGNPTLSNGGATFDLRGNEVFVRGTNRAVFTWNFDSPGWVNLGGVSTSDVAVSISSDNGMQLHVRGTNNRIYLNRRPPGSTRFGGYVNLGGIATGNPAASGGSLITRRTVADQFIVRGTDNRMYGQIQVNYVGGFESYVAFGGPLHG